MNDILNQLSEMKEGDSLLSAMTELPPHSENISYMSVSDRLISTTLAL